MVDKSVKLVLIILFIQVDMCAQDIKTANFGVEDNLSEIAESGNIAEDKVNENLQELDFIKDNPINLNVATLDQLKLFEQYGLLNDIQIQNILFYLYSKQMVSISELMLVKEMDRQTIVNLLPYVCVKPVDKSVDTLKIGNILKYGKHELLVRCDVPLYLRDGYKAKNISDLKSNPNKKYLGEPFYNSLKYGFHYRDKIYFGLAAEKDEGEPFFAKNNRWSYDHMGVYIYVHNIGKIKDLSLGDYVFSCGQGLLINMGYSLGKSAVISTMDLKNSGIKKHASTDEVNYLRGGGITFSNHSYQYTFLYSNRSMDAIIKDNLITSIQTTGYHRIPREVERKEAANLQLIGSHISKRFQYGEIGGTALYYFFNKRYEPLKRKYNTYYMRGKEFFNLGVDYKYRYDRISLSGEVGVGDNYHVALINYLTYKLSDSYQLLFIHRSYSKKYHAYFASSLAEGGMVMNENGFLAGVQCAPARNVNASVYFDYFKFPYLRYGVDKSSHGFDFLLKTSYTPINNLTMNIRYQHKEKMKNVDSKEHIVSSLLTNKLNYQLSYQPTMLINLQMHLSGVEQHIYKQKSAYGYLVAGKVNLNNRKWKLSADCALFHTDNYDTRVYMYERGLLYAFSFMSYYGYGTRYALTSYYHINQHLLLITKWGLTHYFDRNKISSGTEMINGCNKSDVALQIRYKY